MSELERLLEGVEEAGETEDRQLEICLAEKEEEKGNLQLRILELEETISAEVLLCYFPQSNFQVSYEFGTLTKSIPKQLK